MKKKMILLFICSCMFAAILQGCGKNTNTENTKKETESIFTTEQDTQMQDEKNRAYISRYNKDCKLADIGETVNLKGMEYTVNSVMFTKQKGNWDNLNGISGDEVDQNNRLIDKNSYFIVANITVKKLEDNDFTNHFYWNSIWLGILGKSKDTKAMNLEENYSASIVCQSKERENSKSAYQEKFKIGEEKTTDMIYFVTLGKDEVQKKNFYVLDFDPQGLGHSDESPKDYFEVYLKPLEGGLYETNLKK